MASRPLPDRAGDGAEHDPDRDDHEDTEERGQPVERPVRVIQEKEPPASAASSRRMAISMPDEVPFPWVTRLTQHEMLFLA